MRIIVHVLFIQFSTIFPLIALNNLAHYADGETLSEASAQQIGFLSRVVVEHAAIGAASAVYFPMFHQLCKHKQS